jgi:drug/metabolite transporter (DMT)-like permease
MGGLWATFGMTLGAALALLWAARGAPALPRKALAGALLVGLGVMLYGVALAFTDIVRAVLLFYLAPAWSTAIECLFLGRRWSARSVAALALSFLGVATIFRFEVSGGAWNGGDMAALISGMAWSVGAALVFTASGAETARRGVPARLALACSAGAAGAAAAALLIGDEPLIPAALPAALALLSGAVYLAPILFFTMLAALSLAPATMSFLLTAEILSGVASSALLLDEPFGAVEALGALLVAGGALLETTAQPARRATS